MATSTPVDLQTPDEQRAARAGESNARRLWSAASGWRAPLALLLLILFNIAFTDNFVSAGAFNANLTQVATIVIVAVGMTFVIATGGIDLSVGSLMGIAAVLAPLTMMRFIGAPVWLGLILAIGLPVLATGVCGLFNGTLVTEIGLQPIIATLVLYLAGRGIAQVLVNGELIEFRNLNSPVVPPFEFIGLGSVFGIRVQIIVMAVIVLVAGWVLRATTFGRYMLATGGNPAAARLAGVPVKRVLLAVYVISGLLAGLAGLIVATINQSSDPSQVGQFMELDAIAAVAVGGTPLTGGRATVLGTCIGAAIIQVLRFSLISHNIPDGIARVVIAAAIIVAVLLQRQRGS
jgi:ribose/xylose/arabinose/galactoside ABC-type transport system permease subunit